MSASNLARLTIRSFNSNITNFLSYTTEARITIIADKNNINSNELSIGCSATEKYAYIAYNNDQIIKYKDSSNIVLKGNLLPNTDIDYDLGSSNVRWKDLYLSGNTLYIGSSKLSVSPANELIISNLFVLNDINYQGTLKQNGTIFTASSSQSSTSSQWATSNNNIYYNLGNVGIGIINPTNTLHVIGNISFTQDINNITSNELSYLSGLNSPLQIQFTSTSNYVLSTSNFLANAATTASNNIINRINIFYDVNQSNYVVSTSNLLANAATTASNNIINRINTFYDVNQSNYVVSTSNFLANAATTASNNIINRINIFYDVNQSNYVVSTSNFLANAVTTASNNIINRINTFYDVNHSNYVVSTSNFLANAATTASNNIINRINIFYDVNQSNYVVSTSNFLANAVTTASNNIINRVNTYYDVNQSNYVSSTNNRITSLNLDQVANGLSNKYIINNVYNANFTVTGTLNASNLNITGQTTYITTNTYQTENLEITTSANDGVPALKVTQSGGLNIAEFYDTDSNVFIVKKGGNIGIATTDPLDRLHVIGNIRFSQNINGITSNELSTLTGINGNVQVQFTNTSNYVLSTSNFLANAATTASNNIINRINTFYDVNQSNYVVSTSNFLANAATTASNNIINRINTFYDANQSNYVVSTSNFLANAATTASNNIINRINTFYDVNHSNYILSTSNFLANAATTASNNIINRINTFYDVNHSNYILSTSNFLANTATTASNNIINRINTFYDVNQSNYILSTSNFLANTATTASNNIINKINTFYDVNQSNYILSTSNFLANAATTASNNIINRINTFYDVNQSNYVLSTSNFLVNAATTASNNIINRINTFYDINQSNYVLFTSNFLANAATTASNNIINRINTFYDINQSNYVSSTNARITNLNLDQVANGSINRYIINNVYNANLTVTGTLNASNLNITGQTTYITTNTYQTENLEITTSANDGVPALKVTQSGGLNVAEFYDTDSNVFIVKKGGNVGIATTDPLDRLHVIGNIRFSQNINGITSNELSTLTGINNNIQTQFTNTSNYVLSTSNFLANAATTASNNIINRINTFYDVNQSNYVLSTSNFLANAATTASNNIINRINTFYDVNQSNYVLSTSNFLQGQINNKQNKINVAANYLVGTGSIADSLQQIQVSTGLSLTGGILTATGSATDTRWTTVNTNDIYLTNSSGKIGIGTNNPREELHLHNTTVAQNVFTQYSDGTTTGSINRGSIIGKTSTQDFGFSNMEIGKDFVFYTTPTTQGVIAERLRIQSGGNVGISTNNPQEELHLHKTTAVDTRVRFTNSTTGALSSDGSCLGIDASGNLEVRNIENLPIILYTNNTERVRILSGGNVGIGTTNPSTYKLHLENGSLFVGDIANTGTTATAPANGYRLVFDNTYNGTPGTGTSANKIMLFNNNTNIYGFGIENSALVYQSGAAHNFYTGTTNSSYGTLRMFLNSTGDLNVTGNITAYYSDQRLKNITSNITNSLEIVNNLKGFYYTPNDIAHNCGISHTKQEIGISAQDVQKVLPELVTLAPFDIAKDNNDNIISKSGQNYLTIAYERLAPVFIEAIKELHHEIKLLKEENKLIKDKLKSKFI